ncbi:MAG: UbiH/UbiF/VisC/COQ6 family ubiquinone biosynthesis hydroxylase [Caulobacteraceae bacterium]|nr:UbiH/UbiF/VisC/COQ6 family ubiquinone biosynthesis hydroxylase [Caulobacteraceae bacterium]
MVQTHDADVIIAGAGMAGATLALALAQGGLRPLLIDPQPFATQLEPSFDGRSSAIAFSSFRAWDAIGVGDRMRPHAQRIEQILVTDGRRPGASSGGPTAFFLRFDAAEIAARVHSEPLGYMMENRRTRVALSQAVEAAGLTIHAPAKVTGVEVKGAGARVILADGRAFRAPLVIGAEGRGSAVRKAAGIGVLGWDYRQSGVVATLKMERPHNGVAHEYFLPSGPFAILPLTENRASLVWTETTSAAPALKAARPEVFLSLLRRRFGDFLGEVSLTGPTFVYPLSLQLAERMIRPRIALMGDAAHGVHPIAGQGLNLGLRDAAVLAEVLVDAARLGEDIGSETVLARYSAWRRFDTTAMAAGMDAFVHLFSNDNTAVRLARGTGMALVNRIGPARRFFMKEAGGAVGDLPRLFRGQVL